MISTLTIDTEGTFFEPLLSDDDDGLFGSDIDSDNDYGVYSSFHVGYDSQNDSSSPDSDSYSPGGQLVHHTHPLTGTTENADVTAAAATGVTGSDVATIVPLRTRGA